MPTTLPTDPELHEAKVALSQATEVLVKLSGRVRRFLNEQYVDEEHETIVDDATPATLEQIGSLVTWKEEYATYTREIAEYVNTIGGSQTMVELDGARRLHAKRAEIHGVTPRA